VIQPLDPFTVIVIIFIVCVTAAGMIHGITDYFESRMVEREKTKRTELTARAKEAEANAKIINAPLPQLPKREEED
jgi:predicted RND superfamily exporter protein